MNRLLQQRQIGVIRPHQVICGVYRRLDGLGHGLNLFADISPRLARLARQGSNFTGHHGKTTTGVTGPRRLYGCIQGQ